MTSQAPSEPGKMRALLEHVARGLVDDPSQVVVTEEQDGDFMKLHLQVAEADVGKVIGRGGRIESIDGHAQRSGADQERDDGQLGRLHDELEDRLVELQKAGFGHFPVCIAKTQYSFTTDPNAKGAPNDHVLGVREVRLSAGAEFIVAICGEIMTMPGLPRVPAADHIDVNADGRIVGLF